MVKIGVISDTHGLLREEVLEILRDCDCIFHGGDINNQGVLDALGKSRRSMWFGATTTRSGRSSCPMT